MVKSRAVWFAALSLLIGFSGPPALAQQGPAPYMEPSRLLELSQQRQGVAGDQLKQALLQFTEVLGERCEAAPDTVLARFRSALSAWGALNAMQTGFVLDGELSKRLGFQPVRPAQIERAVAAGTPLVNVGVTAKGFGALEWLVVRGKLGSAPAECLYARQVLDEMLAQLDKARSLQKPAQFTQADLDLYANQLMGSVQTLAWAYLEKPLEQARDGVRNPGVYGASGSQWVWLKATWAGVSPQVDDLTSFLAGQGKLQIADQLAAQRDKVNQALLSSAPPNEAGLRLLANHLKLLHQQLQNIVVNDLKVSIRFSSSDGD